jgi:spore coat protein CotH
MLLNRTLLFIAGLVILLTGCGGSSSDSDSDSDNVSDNPDTTTGSNTPSKITPLFSWPPVTGATQYELGFEKIDGTGWQSIIKSSSAFNCQSGSCSYTPKRLSVGTKLRWFVKAYVAAKWQAWSAEKKVTVEQSNISNGGGNSGTDNSGDTQAPTAPSKLQKNKVKAESISFTWVASTDNVKVTAYNIYRNGNFISSTKDTNFKDETVKPNTSYKYQIKAIDAAGNESIASNSLALKTEQAGLTNIKEPSDIYDTNKNVLQMTVKILSGSGACKVDQYDGCTFGQVLNDINWKDDFKPEVKAEFTTEKGFYADATFRQRGGHTRFNPMKSFRVKLEKDSNGKKVYWQGERKIQLLKSFDDLTRVRHKLSYDLFSEVDHLPSMRSQFVRLKVEDKGSFNFARNPSYSPRSSYQETDMGLYLQVEYFGKEYLARRNWKKGSAIYKANNFSFNWDSNTQAALAVDDKGKPYDEKEFEKLLEIKNGKDHRELINFMDAIHDYSNDFNTDVLGKYLDRDNYITWLAVNILTANNDTVAHNYYLYNPKGTSKFYFVPWDYDFAYNGPDIAYSTSGRINMPAKPPYWYTHASRWGNDLHGRFLEDSGNLEALKQRVVALKQSIFTKSNVKAKLASYESAIAYYVTSDVDDRWDIYYQSSESARVEAYNNELDALANNVEKNYSNFLKYFNSPMQFYMDAPRVSRGEFYMTWGDSVSLQGNTVSYDVIISETPQFDSSNIVEKITGITGHKLQMSWAHSSSGQYFVKVIARDSQGNWQSAGNDYDVTDGTGTALYKLHGVEAFNAN